MSTTDHVTHRIVVGVDASPSSRAAVTWAARQAQRRRCDLIITHIDPVSVAPVPGHAAATSSRSLLAASATAASSSQPTVPVTSLLLEGSVSDELIRLSASALLLVIGIDEGSTTQLLRRPRRCRRSGGDALRLSSGDRVRSLGRNEPSRAPRRRRVVGRTIEPARPAGGGRGSAAAQRPADHRARHRAPVSHRPRRRCRQLRVHRHGWPRRSTRSAEHIPHWRSTSRTPSTTTCRN